ncbi:uncharacterized protein LW93_572 [Fusarium fujikuroi]|nr:uncharacterized protein LW93_572 [Fusarium fujikuroi]
MSLIGFSIYSIVMGGKDMSVAQIGRATTDVTKGIFDILTHFLLRTEVNNSFESNVYDSNLEDLAKGGNKNASRETTCVAISIVVIAFIIWDLCNQWDKLSGAGRGLATEYIAILVAAVIVGIIGLFSTCAFIPVIGQVILVVGLVISFFSLVYGRPEPEKTPGEKFVDNMRGYNGWLEKIDDPPSTALECAITPTEIPKDAGFSFQITGKNTKGSSTQFIIKPNTEKLSSYTKALYIKFGFTTGYYTVCLFSNESFSTAPDAKNGKYTYSGPDDPFQTMLRAEWQN